MIEGSRVLKDMKIPVAGEMARRKSIPDFVTGGGGFTSSPNFLQTSCSVDA